MTHSWNDPDEPTGVYDPTRSSMPPADERWFISRDGKAKEQLSAGQIIELCQDGTLSEATLVWRDGLSGWTALGEVPELAQALRAFSKLPPVPRQEVPIARGSLPSLPALRPSLPSLPPPPSLTALAARRVSTTTPPQRHSKMPSIIINERAPSHATPMPLTGRALSLMTISEPYSLRIPGDKRVGVWSLAAGTAALLLGLGLGAFVFADDDSTSDLEALTLNLDQSVAPGGFSSALSAPLAGPSAAQPPPDGLGEVVEVEDPPPAGAPVKPTPAAESESGTVRSEGGGSKGAARSKAVSGGVASTFDKAAADSALGAAAGRAARCKPAGGPKGTGQVRVTYGSTGQVKSVAVLTPRFKNSSAASCIQMVFRGAKVAAFSGPDTSVTRSFTIQ